MRKLLIAPLTFLLVSVWPVAAQELPSAEEIMKKAILKMISDNELKGQKFAYTKIQTESDLDKNGDEKPRSQKVKKFSVSSNPNGGMLEKLIEENGVLKKSKPKHEETMADGKPSLENIFKPGRYNYYLAGLSELEGHEVYTIGFNPQSQSEQPEFKDGFKGEIANTILNNLYGLIHIDKESFAVLRAEAHLHTPELGVAPTATLHRFDVVTNQQEISGVLVGKKVVMISSYTKFFFFNSFKKLTLEYRDYMPK